MKLHTTKTLMTLAILFFPFFTIAGQVTLSYWPDQINNNWYKIERGINSNDTRLQEIEALLQEVVAANTVLQEENLALKERVAVLEASPVAIDGLADYVSVEMDQHGYPAVIFDAVNVYVRNGEPNTSFFADGASNGLGNLFIGYNELSNGPVGPHCSGGYFAQATSSKGEVPTQESCEADGFVWSENHKTGSHNLVIGDGHSYTGAYSIVSGTDNMVLDGANFVTGNANVGAWASVVLMGSYNRAYLHGTIMGIGNVTTALGEIIYGEGFY